MDLSIEISFFKEVVHTAGLTVFSQPWQKPGIGNKYDNLLKLHGFFSPAD